MCGNNSEYTELLDSGDHTAVPHRMDHPEDYREGMKDSNLAKHNSIMIVDIFISKDLDIIIKLTIQLIRVHYYVFTSIFDALVYKKSVHTLYYKVVIRTLFNIIPIILL